MEFELKNRSNKVVEILCEGDFSDLGLCKKIFEKVHEALCFGKFASNPKIKIRGGVSLWVVCILKNVLFCRFKYIAVFDEKLKKFKVLKSNNPKMRKDGNIR